MGVVEDFDLNACHAYNHLLNKELIYILVKPMFRLSQIHSKSVLRMYPCIGKAMPQLQVPFYLLIFAILNH